MGHESPSLERRERVERKDWGIALSVSEDCEGEAFRIRDSIIEKGVAFDLALERNPHVTLFQGEFTSASHQAIEKVVIEVLNEFYRNSQDSLILEMEDNLYLRQGNNNIFWNVKSSEWLTRLHLSLDERLRSLPEWGIMKQFRDRIEQGKLTSAELAHVEKYGVLSAGSQFLPHITIGKLANGTDFDRIKGLPVRPVSFVAEHLITGMVDRYGRIESIEMTNDMKADFK